MDQADYIYDVFHLHAVRSGVINRLNGATILELGPGDSIATALLAYSYGARAILIDSGDFATKDAQFYRDFAGYLGSRGLPSPDLSGAYNLDHILKACNAQYLTNGLNSIQVIENNSVDFIFSQAVLEHIPQKEFSRYLDNFYRILFADGCISHRVDMKDHLGGALNHLRFCSSLWESDFFTRSGFYTNRISFSRMIASMIAAGFEVELLKIDKWAAPPIKLSQVTRDLDHTLNDCFIQGFDVLMTPLNA